MQIVSFLTAVIQDGKINWWPWQLKRPTLKCNKKQAKKIQKSKQKKTNKQKNKTKQNKKNKQTKENKNLIYSVKKGQ